MDPLISRHHGLLGTVIELQVWAGDPDTATTVDAAVITEMERLQRVFDAFDPASDLRRWREGGSCAPELASVLELAERWRDRSGGAFDPAAGALVELWDVAASAGQVPSADARRDAVRAMHDNDDRRSRLSNLNAIAKGWIVDRCVDRAFEVAGLDGLLINAGGDLRHRGPEPLVVGVEDPARPYDNVPPLVRVSLGDGAIATSGGARRGWQIEGRWYSHVIDPRSGRPVEHIAQASVLAGDAATADVVATVLSVVHVREGLDFADELGDVGCCVVTSDGARHRNGVWAERELAP